MADQLQQRGPCLLNCVGDRATEESFVVELQRAAAVELKNAMFADGCVIAIPSRIGVQSKERLVHQVIVNTVQSYSACAFVAAEFKEQLNALDPWTDANAVVPVTRTCDSQPNVYALLTLP